MNEKLRAVLGQLAGLMRVADSKEPNDQPPEVLVYLVQVPTEEPDGTRQSPPLTRKEEDDSKRALYQSYLDDFARIGSRHEAVRTFYISVLTVLSGLTALTGKDGAFQALKSEFFYALAVVGIIICVAWILHMEAFATLFRAKRNTLKDLETDAKFLLSPFTKEAAHLDAKPYSVFGKRLVRVRLSRVDQLVAGAFLLLFGLLLFDFFPMETTPVDE